jgi:transposase-like protein
MCVIRFLIYYYLFLLNIIKVKGEWVSLYRAVDSRDTLDFMLSDRRDEEAATAFLVVH